MGYLKNDGTEIEFKDMDGKEVYIGSRIYPPEGGQELRVAWFQPDYPEIGDALMCQQVNDLDAFSPITQEDCRKYWRIAPEKVDA